ncbi:MAG TPA: hypothetical protein VLG76_01795 [Rhabdochlamydiaceae bacterium]|nr:hypothetical protein [Rhabdochlamydiaceae bacterium]
MQKSFKMQINQSAQVTIPLPKLGLQRQKPFPGTCAELLKEISGTMHRTMDHLDYDGLKPFLKMSDEMEKGKNIEEWRIDSRGEESTRASTCSGQSHIILKNLKEKHGIVGEFAVVWEDRFHDFDHAAVIIECKDGYVLLDPRFNPNTRIFSIPFECEVAFEHFSIKAGKKGVFSPFSPLLTLKYHGPEEKQLEITTMIENGDDIVMKHYMTESVTSFIPIVIYQKDGKPFKDIKIFPSLGKIVLKNHITNDKLSISFEAIRKGGFSAVAEFMGSDFHIDIQTACDELQKFIFHHEKIMKVFNQSLH